VSLRPDEEDTTVDVPMLLARVGDTAQVRRGFGQTYELDGATVIPVALVAGGGGGGGGHDDAGSGGDGGGVGFGVRPLGVFVVRDGEIRWRPCVDVQRLAFLAASVAGVALLRRRPRRRRR
jgi:uncharacterized spore protein YtfJ